MARQFGALIFAALALVPTAFPEDSPPNGKPSSPMPSARRQGAELGPIRRAFEALSPEQRQRFIENLKRWSSIPPEEKKALVDREGLRRKKIAEEIEHAISDSGLTLVGERRAAFEKRYAEERRKVEEQLRKELEEKRKPLVKDMVARLKAEFSTEGTAP